MKRRSFLEALECAMTDKDVMELMTKVSDCLPSNMRVLWSAGVNEATVIAICKQHARKNKKP